MIRFIKVLLDMRYVLFFRPVCIRINQEVFRTVVRSYARNCPCEKLEFSEFSPHACNERFSLRFVFIIIIANIWVAQETTDVWLLMGIYLSESSRYMCIFFKFCSLNNTAHLIFFIESLVPFKEILICLTKSEDVYVSCNSDNVYLCHLPSNPFYV